MSEYAESEDYNSQGESRWSRFIAILNWRNWTQSAETSYLAVLRYLALVGATLLVVVAIALFLWGAAVQLRSSEVKPESLTIAGSDLASAISTPDTAANTSGDAPAKPKGWEQYLSPKFRAAYFSIYNSNFAGYRRNGDAAPNEKAFFEELFPQEVLDGIDSATAYDIDRSSVPEGLATELGTGNVVLLTLYNSVKAASIDVRVKKELQAYKAAQKTQVCRNVTTQGSRSVPGWDYYSTSCVAWDVYPYGCPQSRTVSVPVTRRVCSMQFPENLSNPLGIMNELQQQYFVQMSAKHVTAADDAAAKSTRIITQKARGLSAIGDAAKALMAFLAVMFLYLLIAIERHYRILARRDGDAAN